MAILNVTLNGRSADTLVEIDRELSDTDLKRVAVELLRSGGLPGFSEPELRTDAFDNYVVDRFNTPEGGQRLYLRPKVPFGA